jgi:hypothetical protein
MFASGLGGYGNRPRRGFDRAVALGWLAEDQQQDRAAVSVAFAAFTRRAMATKGCRIHFGRPGIGHHGDDRQR